MVLLWQNEPATEGGSMNAAAESGQAARIRRAGERFGGSSRVFQAWNAIDADFRLVCADGVTRVMVFIPGKGSTLVEWFGPDALDSSSE